jgi:hypothetical protein
MNQHYWRVHFRDNGSIASVVPLTTVVDEHWVIVEAATEAEGMAERDEGARVEANLERQRDRRAEIRLEVLIECRDQWTKARNVGLFTRWLLGEIETLAHGKKGAAA